MTEMKSDTAVSNKYCKTIARLSRIAEQFLIQDEKSSDRKSEDMMSLLQRCLDTLEAYQDEYKKLKISDRQLSQDEIFDIYEGSYVYYKIVHNTVLNKVPNLKEFQIVKRQTNSNDKKLMEIYNMLVQSLLNDDKIGYIKAFLKKHSKPDVSQSRSQESSLSSGDYISPSQLEHILENHGDSTLVIDLRQRSEFTKSHIDAKNIICIEPISFKSVYTDLEIEKKSLITSPKKEITLFRARDSFEYIVLYTEEDNGRTRNSFYVQQERILLELLLSRSFAKPLSPNSKILILKAGFSSWISEKKSCITNGDESPDSSHNEIYLNGNTSSLSLRSLPKLSPDISSSMDGSMHQMMSSSYHAQSNGQHHVQQQPSSTSTKNLFSSSLSHSPSPQLVLSSHSSGSKRTAQYPETPNLIADGNSLSNAVHHKSILPISTRALTPTGRNYLSPQATRVLMAQNGDHFNTSHVASRPPSQPIPSLPQLPSRENSPASSISHTKKYDLDFTVGLENMGNSCYINCIVQCLLGTHELTNIFLNNSYEKHINLNSKLGSKGVLAKYFARLIHSMHQNGSFKPGDKNKSVQPLQFKMACGSINALFKESGQQDCQEFCQFLLDGLHEDLNQCGGNPPLKELSPQAEKMREKLSFRIASSIEWERFLTTDFSVIVDLFQGQYASQLKCQVCNHTSTTYQPFSVLSVPVPRAKSCNLIDCFKEFTKVEKLETDEEWSCPQCKKKQPSTKKLTITRLPRNLIIHLKRFDNMLNKNNVFVKYPFLLDLTPYWANDFDGRLPPGVTEELPTRGQVPPFNYKLYAVASHVGSLYGGHYTAYVDKGINRGWFYFDDTSYRRVRSATECITSNAYVLFYHRVYHT